MAIIADIPASESTTNQSKFSVEFIHDEKKIDRTIMSDEYSFWLKDYLQKNPLCFSVNYNRDFLSSEVASEATNIHEINSANNFVVVNKENYLVSPRLLGNISLLMVSYQKELERFSKRYPVNLGLVDKAYSFMYKQLYHLPFENCAVEINNESLKITLKFPDNKQLMITKDIESEDACWDQIRYSYFINRKLIASNVAKLEEFSKKFTEYIIM